MINIRTFGSVGLADEAGRAIEAVLAQPKRLALLIYLSAHEAGRVHQRDALLPLFWSAMDEAHARDALNQALRFLRLTLGSDVFARRGADAIAINPAAAQSDVAAFRAAVQEGDDERALALYRGPFLDGFFAEGAAGFEEWMERERASLRSLAAASAWRLAARAEANGATAGALSWGRRAIELAPDDEPAVRRLLDLHDRLGDRAGALRLYEWFAHRLRTEYDCEPAPETRALVGRVKASGASAPSAAPPPPNEPESAVTKVGHGDGAIAGRATTGRLTRSARAVAYVAIAAIPVLGAAWWTRRGAADPPTVRYEVRLPRNATLAPLGGSPVAIATDGRFVAFTSAQSGVRRLYLHSAGELDAREVRDTENARFPFFSPDGTRVAFFVGRWLMTATVDGSASARLADVPGATHGTWTRESGIVVAVGGVLTAISSSGTLQSLATPDSQRGEIGLTSPVALADGRTLLYTSMSGAESGRIGVISLADRSRAVLDIPARGAPSVGAGGYALGVIDDYVVYLDSATVKAVKVDLRARRVSGAPISLIGGVTAAHLSPDGSLVYARTRQRQQLVLASPGRASRVLLAEPRRYLWPRVSPDGKRVAVTVGDGPRSDIWTFELPDGPLTRLTNDGVMNRRAEWTPDGRSVLYVSDRGGRNALWTQPADGSGVTTKLLGLPDANVDEGVLTNNGRVLVYQRDASGIGELWYRLTRGDTAARRIPRLGTAEMSPRLSPDGKWLAYQALEGDSYRIYVRPFPSLDARYRVSVDGGVTPVWSPDGKRIIYMANQTLVAATIGTQPEFHVVSRTPLLEGEYALVVVHPDFDVLPDGESLILPRPVDNAWWPLVVQNWRRELRGRVRAGR
jgi:DNA-binding SARP family transcriptional activator/Tol biopolymer transport system component